MPAQRPLLIPDLHLEAFKLLEQMTPADATLLVDALASVKFPARYSDAVTAVAELRQMEPDEAVALVNALVSLCNVGIEAQDSSTVTAERIVAAEQITSDPERKAAFVERLSGLIDNRAVRLLGKAVLIGTQYPQMFAEVQILTDIRPMFDTEIKTTPGPEGALLVHSLRIRYTDSKGELADFYVAMDDIDLGTLSDAIERAHAKSSALEASLERFGVPQIVS